MVKSIFAKILPILTRQAGLAQGWLRAGSGLAQGWLRAGSGLAQGWLRADSGLAQAFLRDMLYLQRRRKGSI